MDIGIYKSIKYKIKNSEHNNLKYEHKIQKYKLLSGGGDLSASFYSKLENSSDDIVQISSGGSGEIYIDNGNPQYIYINYIKEIFYAIQNQNIKYIYKWNKIYKKMAIYCQKLTILV